MDEKSLKQKLVKWLDLKKEADALEKAIDGPRTSDRVKGIHGDEGHFDVGTSNVGQKVRAYAPDSGSSKSGKSGVMRWVKSQHKKKLSEMQSMPKPNLPKSESEPLDKNKYIKGMMSEMRQQKGLPETPQARSSLDYSNMKAPAEKKIVQGQRMTPRSPVGVSGKSDKLFDPRLSGNKKPEIKKAGEPQPAIVSEPTIVATQSSTSTPRTVESPNVMNGYSIIGDFLKRKKKK